LLQQRSLEIISTCGRNSVFLQFIFLDHFNEKPHLVFKLKPKIAHIFGLLPALLIPDFIFTLSLLSKVFVSLAYSKNEIVFNNHIGTQPSISDLVFVNSNDTIVAGKAELCVASEQSNPVRGYVKQLVGQAYSFLFHEFLPSVELWKCFHWVSPLSAQKSSLRLLEADRNKQAIIFVII
jgi:hypothetical protein